ncbi:flagellar motor protein MotB [Paenibacillus sp. YPG26]|uniref:flagellar motor protein MotB n=1 Tax=Paenibacillus sp. YPG26 TaxID=2878915 RepID=UPI00203A73E8|nr:flagellar motor protein MotB [Paenibacillus sp. YPG26]USB33352.1 flagellar motor protein MotB [Paenibacillus sp. YPG26]
MSKKNRHEPHEEHADESWLIPYADLLTLLLALFIVLYGMSSTDAKKFEQMSKAFSIALNGGVGVMDKSPSIEGSSTNAPKDSSPQQSTQNMSMNKKRSELMRQEQEDLEKLKKQMDNYIKVNGLSSQLDTKLNQSQLTVTISDKALFASGDDTVKPDSRKLAKAISVMLQGFPDYDIIVSGHTDNVPISNQQFDSNWDLSSGRALNFMKILLINGKLDPRKFVSTGYGEYRPVAPNNTAEGRAKNRRVEVSILRKYQSDAQKSITSTP